MGRNLQRLGNKFSISIPTDENGLVGRECPQQHCLGYFKIKFGTGLKGESLPCHCPYCGHKGNQKEFWTHEQLDYAKSIVAGKVFSAIREDFRDMARSLNSKGGFVRMDVNNGPTTPVRYYREKQLETDIMCSNCTLEYAVYGVFAFCPDCGAHNSWQILDKNLELAQRELVLADSVEGDLVNYLIHDALENAVSAFDGFGRELCKVHAARATNPAQAQSVSFQNLAGAQRNLSTLFSIDIAAGIDAADWTFALRCFQKRHLLAHSMGVIDDKYIRATSDPNAVVGRKVVIRAEEVTALIALLRTLGMSLAANIAGGPSTSTP